MVDELSGSKGSRDIANLPYFSESFDLDLILACVCEFVGDLDLTFRISRGLTLRNHGSGLFVPRAREFVVDLDRTLRIIRPSDYCLAMQTLFYLKIYLRVWHRKTIRLVNSV